MMSLNPVVPMQHSYHSSLDEKVDTVRVSVEHSEKAPRLVQTDDDLERLEQKMQYESQKLDKYDSMEYTLAPERRSSAVSQTLADPGSFEKTAGHFDMEKDPADLGPMRHNAPALEQEGTFDAEKATFESEDGPFEDAADPADFETRKKEFQHFQAHKEQRPRERRHRVKRKVKPGRVWSMTPSQEIALKQFWAILLKSFGYDINYTQEELQSGTCLIASSKKSRPDHARRRERRSATDSGDSGSSRQSRERARAPSAQLLEQSFVFQFSYNRIKLVFYLLETGSMERDNLSNVFSLGGGSMHSTLLSFAGEDLHKSLWASCRNDNLDNYLLRLLREKDFHVTKALKMFAAIFDWRLNTHGVEDLLCKGDAHFYFEGKNPQLVQTFMRNEIFTRGKARNGEPLIHVRVRKHVRSNCLPAEYEKFLILIYEWVRLQFSETRLGIDQCQLIFDLSGFTMKNADLHTIRFLVKCHQTYFPHFVGTIYMHNAPKVFALLWNVVVKWMNLRLRDVIVFTNGYEQLHQRIPSRFIPKLLGGKDHEVPPFIEPTLYNFQRKVPDERFGDLVRERDDLTVNFIEATVKWIEATDADESREHLDAKIRLAAQKAHNYIDLDPYLRLRGVPDRNGEIGTLYY